MFDALLIRKTDSGSSAAVETLDESQLPEGDVLVRVEHSTLNYKDGLAITGKSPVVRSFPMVPGIDFAGTVEQSTSARWNAGDGVILNGFGVGESRWGGLAQKARVKGDWLVRRPASISARQSMAIGTAGYTAMLCVMALQGHGVEPGSGEILVTGAKGGVGSIAIAVLSRLGFDVVASTGQVERDGDYLRSLGARTIIDRAELSVAGKPLQKDRWAGVVDAVGSHTLANACAQTRYRGAVTCCGLAQGMDFPATVAPFILRGVTLYGIDSVMAPLALRERAWEQLALHLDLSTLDSLTGSVALRDVPEAALRLMAGEVRGRLVVDL